MDPTVSTEVEHYQHHHKCCYYTSKMNKEQPTIPKEQAAKQSKTAVNNVDMAHAPKHEVEGPLGTPTPETLVENLNDAPSGPSPQVEQGVQQTGNKNRTKPRVR